MSNAVQKPVFTSSVLSNPVPSEQIDSKMSELIEERRQRPEIGAIWTRKAKTSNMEFLKLRIRLTKEQLSQLALSSDEEQVTVELVAFPNTYKDSNDKRPSYRIYEAKE